MAWSIHHVPWFPRSWMDNLFHRLSVGSTKPSTAGALDSMSFPNDMDAFHKTGKPEIKIWQLNLDDRAGSNLSLRTGGHEPSGMPELECGRETTSMQLSKVEKILNDWHQFDGPNRECTDDLV